MTFKRLLVLMTAFCFLIFSTLISWYEGAQLLDDPWEWKYTALFSNWLNGEVKTKSDIMEIDYFVYAAKFEPLFPFLMVSAALVILFQLVTWLLKGKEGAMNLFFMGMAILFFCASGMLASSPTTGLTFFAIYFGVLGIVATLFVFLPKAQRMKLTKKA
ncbi:YjdJ family protein [Planococcus sp. N028]|uniref:YjdJ family protein n=1 Tax=Planococcus shixiaomingii TaxID=3058393 RepID=A0ABT8MYL9_9BACL|nr:MULTISPECIES: YjdJ family protein [unclassified Planococcus (in: firmicutes)]MDN7240731.1 YjdJ family protein [Planococcus sp. N028]WKA56636.1 YjdJ family protein [Planococcus sp. N022]